jgi:hypothetical protein
MQNISIKFFRFFNQCFTPPSLYYDYEAVANVPPAIYIYEKLRNTNIFFIRTSFFSQLLMLHCISNPFKTQLSSQRQRLRHKKGKNRGSTPLIFKKHSAIPTFTYYEYLMPKKI